MDLKDSYNKIAEDWHKDHLDDDWWIAGTEKFISLLGDKKEVLDVGCGAGTKSKFLKERGLSVTGIDFSEKMIEIAKRENPDISFEVLDMREVEKISGMYDGIFVQAALLHIPRAEASKVISNLAHKLKKDGLLYIAVKQRRIDGVAEEIKVEDDYGYPYERFFSYYTVGDIKQYFESAKLTVVHEEIPEKGNTNWIQVIGKKLVA